MSELPGYSSHMRKRLLLVLAASTVFLSSCGWATDPQRWECPWTVIQCGMPPR